MTATRRPLRFETLDDAVRDAEHLLAVGYDRTGKWDLAQACGHLAEWLRYAVDGYPPTPLVARPVIALVRWLVAPRMLRKAFETWTIKENGPTVKKSIPAPGGDPAAAVAKLREAVVRFQSHPGEYAASPLFGRLDRETMTRLHRLHASHHLGYLTPKA